MTAQEGLTNDLSHPGQSIVLIGLMGAGKTSVGRRLATRLRLEFKDSDHEIEEASGCTIADIFETYGEPAFRDVERRVIQRLLSNGPIVLATGGGAFVDAETRSLIKNNSLTVWLRADLETLIERTTGRTHRPILNSGDPQIILRNLIDYRYPLYGQADLTVDTCHEPLARTVDRVVKTLNAAHQESISE